MERTNRTPWCSLGELKSPPLGPTSEEEAEASSDDPSDDPSTDLSQRAVVPKQQGWILGPSPADAEREEALALDKRIAEEADNSGGASSSGAPQPAAPRQQDYPTTGPNQRHLVNYRRVVLQALQMDQIRWEMENLQTWFARMRRKDLIGLGIREEPKDPRVDHPTAAPYPIRLAACEHLLGDGNSALSPRTNLSEPVYVWVCQLCGATWRRVPAGSGPVLPMASVQFSLKAIDQSYWSESLPYWLQTSLPTVQTVGRRPQTPLKETKLPPKPPPQAWREWKEQQQRQEQAAPNPQKHSQFDELD